MDFRNRFRLESLGIFLIALLLFTLGIWDEQPQGFDGRWALFLQEMFRHGASLFPTTYGQPYADYPGTATFFSFVFARLFGAPNHLANILPTALASAGVVALIYRLLVPSSRPWALLTVLLTLLTTQLLEKSRSVCLDQMVALLCVGSFYLLHSGERLGSRLRQLAVFPLFILGFAIRGPLGLIEVCGVVCVYWALGKPGERVKQVLIHGIVGLPRPHVIGSTVFPGSVEYPLLRRPEVRANLPHAPGLADQHQGCQVSSGGKVETGVNRSLELFRFGIAKRPHVRADKWAVQAHTLIKQQVAGGVAHAGHPLGLLHLFAQIGLGTEQTQCRVGCLPRFHVHQVAAFSASVEPTHDARVFADLGVIDPLAQQVGVVGCLGTDRDQQRRFVGTLAGGDGVNEVRLRPSYLADLIEDGQHGRQSVCGLAIGSQGAKLGVQVQPQQTFAAGHDANDLGQGRR